MLSDIKGRSGWRTLLRNKWGTLLRNTGVLSSEYLVILLNRANKVLGIIEISIGGTAATIADPKVIFVAALKSAANGIIIVHNHPSGQLKPSTADIELTRKIKEGGRLLDVSVLDHLILSRDGYYSFADEGMI